MESTYSHNQTLPHSSSEPQIASNLPIYLGAFLVIGSTSLFINFFSQITSKLPTINPAKSRWSDQDAKKLYNFNARQLIADGFRKFGGPFNLLTDNGPEVMLPPEYIDAVNAENKLSFNLFIKNSFLSQYETFRTFSGAPEGMFESAVMKGLTRSLPKFTKDLSAEMTECLDDSWGKSTEWHESSVGIDVLSWVARLSCRIFTGGLLSKNEEWLRISRDFTINVFEGVRQCKQYPPGPLQWFAERTLAVCKQARRDHAASSALLAPIIAERQKIRADAEKRGVKAELPDDSIEWFREAAKGRAYNEADLQLGLATAAIHTTSDLLSQAILNLCANPEMVEPLREEAVHVLRKFGWQKVALTELRLLDSFSKETQRLKPISMASMHRTATADLELPGGIKIRKGERTAISSHRMWSPEDYEDPEKFDGFRYFERRKRPGFENKSMLVSTSHDHLGFSHGKHACPGRFFAANEVKIAMVHLLLKYDMKLVDPKMADSMSWGVAMMANRGAKLMVRRREAELDIESLTS